jgi:hypothetical protein
MPMTAIQVGDQTIRYDRDATAAIYVSLQHGFAENCGCLFCKNFAAQRNLVYPASFKALLEQLGIDPNKEAEVFEYGPVEDGYHLYGGWFYFVGEMVKAGERNSNAGGQFEFWFTSIGPDAAAFHAGPRLTLEFTTHLKWVLLASPDSARLSAIRPQ